METSRILSPGRADLRAPVQAVPRSIPQFNTQSRIGQSEYNDDDLVIAARGGDEAAFRLLVERYSRLAARLASRFFGQRDMIEEITQISFMQAWCALGSYQARGENSFAAWLARITINTCHDELRRAWRRKEDVFSALNERETQHVQHCPNAADIERALISGDLARKLLARLEPEDQVALTLLKIEGWSVAEIAAHLNWSPAKVKMRVHRARHIFQRVRRRYC